MRRAIGHLETLSDPDLFENLSDGMALIVDNAARLENTACRLHRDGDLRASEIMCGFAEEEAAKFLILIDFVRCPRDFDGREPILRRFYGHVAKRIYAMTCSYPRIASFGELSELVERECRPWYLDGPNGIDWIFRNDISAEREQAMYVDYVRDVTDEAGGYFWLAPDDQPSLSSEYTAPECVKLIQALAEAGAGSADGLAEIAAVWRGFKPEPGTDRECLRGLIVDTLDRLAFHYNAVDEPSAQLIVWHWSFPMWPLAMKERRPADRDLDSLREERQHIIKWIEETEAKRDPPPAITRAKVEDLSEAHAAWKGDVEKRAARSGRSASRRLQVRSSSDIARDFELPSYARVAARLRELSEGERAALVALGWFAREQVADWPRTYQRAIEQTPTLDDSYQIGLGSYWRPGLDRWEAEPRSFEAGRWYRSMP